MPRQALHNCHEFTDFVRLLSVTVCHYPSRRISPDDLYGVPRLNMRFAFMAKTAVLLLVTASIPHYGDEQFYIYGHCDALIFADRSALI